MKIARMILMAGLGLGLSACAAVDVTTRDAPFEPLPVSAVAAPPGYELTQPALAPQGIDVTKGAAALATLAPASNALAPYQSPVSINSIVVSVPRSLKVSERNSYLPRGDIVWRGDPIGDRYVQIQHIFEAALLREAADLKGPVKVDLVIEVKRFHALTEKARYTTGGVHSITFDLAIRDPQTGNLVVPVRTVRADLEEFGGQQAILADARGETQKVRITNHLAEVIRQELSNPEGYKNASLGFIQLLNNL
jgi:hypothetical protein